MLSTFESVKHLTTDNTSDRNGQKSVIELTPKRSNREKNRQNAVFRLEKVRFLFRSKMHKFMILTCINLWPNMQCVGSRSCSTDLSNVAGKL